MKKILLSRLDHKYYRYVGVFFLVLVVIITFRVVENQYNSLKQQVKTDTETALIGRPLEPGDHTIGNIKAPIQLIVYANLECQYCKHEFTSTIPHILQEYGDKVVVVYRHVSLSSIRSADDEAEAAECVAIQGGDAMFWKFIGAVYDFPKYPHHLDAAAIKTITRSVGVDLHLFSNCMQYHNGLPRVAEDANESAIAGIITSPTVIVRSSTRAIPVVGDNEALVRGAVDYILSTNQYQK